MSLVIELDAITCASGRKPNCEIPLTTKSPINTALLYADEDVLIQHGHTTKISTGNAFDIPSGYCLKVYGRSGLGYKHGLSLVCGGIIDQSYKGDVFVSMTRVITGSYLVKKGDRIAQAMLIPVPVVTFEEVTELSDSERGEGGFGSSGR